MKRYSNLTKKYVKINEWSDILDLVRISINIDGDITAYKGRYAVDCKSALGVFSLDLSTGVTIEYPSEAEEMDKFLEKFEVTTS